VSKTRRGRGPATTVWTPQNRPKSRQHSSLVWRAAVSVLGFPPSWMRMVPANRYADTPDGRVLLKTTRWEIARSENDKHPIIISGPAKKAAEELLTMEVSQ